MAIEALTGMMGPSIILDGAKVSTLVSYETVVNVEVSVSYSAMVIPTLRCLLWLRTLLSREREVIS